MTERPLLEDFQRAIEQLRSSPILSPAIKRGEVHLGSLSLEGVAKLMRVEAG